MVAVGVDEGGPVLRGADRPLGLGHAGVALDGVQRQVQSPCAFEQPDALVQQHMDLGPALAGGHRPGTVLRRHGGLGPAGAVRGDLLAHRLSEVVPEVPAVSDLHRIRQGTADGL